MSKNALDISGDLGLGRGLKPGSLNDLDIVKNVQHVLKKPVTFSSSLLTTPSHQSSSLLCHPNGGLSKKHTTEVDELTNLKIELEVIKQELETVLQKLHSKQQAIHIFQQQLLASRIENDKLENKLKWFHSTLIKDFNNLQFKVEQEREVTRQFRASSDQHLRHLQEENSALKELFHKQQQQTSQQPRTKQSSLATVLESLFDCPDQNPLCEVPEQIDCDCFSLEFHKCACAKQADLLLRHLKQLKGRCPSCRQSLSARPVPPPCHPPSFGIDAKRTHRKTKKLSSHSTLKCQSCNNDDNINNDNNIDKNVNNNNNKGESNNNDTNNKNSHQNSPDDPDRK